MAKTSTKQAAKGKKQIVEENATTLNFYRNLSVGANGTYIFVIFLYLKLYTWPYLVGLTICIGMHVGCYVFMSRISIPKYDEAGQLTDSGVDLNMEGGISEHAKDLIILTCGCQLLSLMSNYSWLLLIMVPLRVFWLYWVNFLQPYILNKPPPAVVNEKKQKRMERKMKKADKMKR